jgi:hypothetical protein
VAPPGPDSQLEDAIENALLDDAWVEDFLGAPLTQDKLPAHITDYLFDGTVSYVPRDNYSTDTIIQRYAVPETCSTLALLGFGTLSLLAWDSRRRTAKA